jgi:RNA polymerase sigma-70 factor (ECF subfamily)
MINKKDSRHKTRPFSVPGYEDLDDEVLMLRYADGNEKAFEELYRRYNRKAYGYIAKHIRAPELISEVFQQVMLKLHKSREQYQPGRLFSAWFFSICRSSVIDQLRSGMRQVSTEPIESDQFFSSKPSFDFSDELDEALVEGLSKEQRKAIKLRFESGLEFEDIARELKTTQENARQLISRAVRKLRKILKRPA